MRFFYRSAILRAYSCTRIPQCVIISIAQNKIDTSWTSQLVFSDLETPVMDFVQSVGDLLSWSRINVFYSAGQGELRVMNWKTGAIVWVSFPFASDNLPGLRRLYDLGIC